MDAPEHPNAERLRRYYAALAAGDAGTLLALIDPACVFHIPGDGMLAGEYRGPEQIGTLGMRAWSETDGTMRMELIDVLANDLYAVSLHHWTAERKGRRADMRNLNVYRFGPDGKIVERWELIEDQTAHDEFWSVRALGGRDGGGTQG